MHLDPIFHWSPCHTPGVDVGTAGEGEGGMDTGWNSQPASRHFLQQKISSSINNTEWRYSLTCFKYQYKRKNCILWLVFYKNFSVYKHFCTKHINYWIKVWILVFAAFTMEFILLLKMLCTSIFTITYPYYLLKIFHIFDVLWNKYHEHSDTI